MDGGAGERETGAEEVNRTTPQLNDYYRTRVHHHRVMGLFFCGGNTGCVVG